MRSSWRWVDFTKSCISCLDKVPFFVLKWIHVHMETVKRVSRSAEAPQRENGTQGLRRKFSGGVAERFLCGRL